MTLPALPFHDGKTVAILVLAISASVLGTAYASQYLGGLQPCNLCLYQRWPWWIAGGIAAIAAFAPIAPIARYTICAMAGLSILAGAGIAVYHTGVEQHWWEGPSACAGGAMPTSLADMQRMMAIPIVPCDKPAWTLFGVSMAGYNAVFSALFGGFVTARAIQGLRGGEFR
jgi:disulfide bond formation protein DsbB